MQFDVDNKKCAMETGTKESNRNGKTPIMTKRWYTKQRTSFHKSLLKQNRNIYLMLTTYNFD